MKKTFLSIVCCFLIFSGSVWACEGTACDIQPDPGMGTVSPKIRRSGGGGGGARPDCLGGCNQNGNYISGLPIGSATSVEHVDVSNRNTITAVIQAIREWLKSLQF